MDLNYDAQTDTLEVNITHNVANSSNHYIHQVVISKNGEEYRSFDYNKQPTNSNFTYVYEVDSKPGDKIKVFIDCVLGGSLTKSITVPENENHSEHEHSHERGDETNSSQTVKSTLSNIAHFPIFGVSIIVWVGLLALIFFLTAATVALLIVHGKLKATLKWHYRLAYIALVIGLIHGVVGLIINL